MFVQNYRFRSWHFVRTLRPLSSCWVCCRFRSVAVWLPYWVSKFTISNWNNWLKIPTKNQIVLVFLSECVEIELRAKTETYERCGDRYVRILHLDCTFDVMCNFHVDFDFDTPLPVAKDMFNGIINDNWRTFLEELKPNLEYYTSTIIYNIVSPILAAVPVKEFYKKSIGQC